MQSPQIHNFKLQSTRIPDRCLNYAANTPLGYCNPFGNPASPNQGPYMLCLFVELLESFNYLCICIVGHRFSFFLPLWVLVTLLGGSILVPWLFLHTYVHVCIHSFIHAFIYSFFGFIFYQSRVHFVFSFNLLGVALPSLDLLGLLGSLWLHFGTII